MKVKDNSKSRSIDIKPDAIESQDRCCRKSSSQMLQEVVKPDVAGSRQARCCRKSSSQMLQEIMTSWIPLIPLIPRYFDFLSRFVFGSVQ